MVTIMKIVSIIMGVFFPAFLIKAVRATDNDSVSKYTAGACISFGVVLFTVMGLL
ncbi:hypothetical protein SDC9_148883 [bioreactor metagenome]|uniref:Uncharacterized protein n=1 Tax=bioreactor metagenome TaxID=1076179 RepID=A0A645EK65_9ZZZZ